MRDLGPGRETHPEEWQRLIQEAEDKGVEIRSRPGGIAYNPGGPGDPGQIILDPDASIWALRHEMSHMRDNEAAGWPGTRAAYDRRFLAASEERSYNLEIDGARAMGRDDLADQLVELRDTRLREIKGNLDLGEDLLPREVTNEIFGDWDFPSGL
ncbi:hypothetical protein AB0B28_04890 [Glycomyces sp. NPDC046736]|uniref:hypothetical protein n=1 Tax=Glycomyces sp. NPDC046736 TaxID=3155615 RepID=UPI0033DC5CFD